MVLSPPSRGGGRKVVLDERGWAGGRKKKVAKGEKDGRCEARGERRGTIEKRSRWATVKIGVVIIL